MGLSRRLGWEMIICYGVLMVPNDRLKKLNNRREFIVTIIESLKS